MIGGFQNENAGSSRWTYARKDGRNYFIKEFCSPIYPDDVSLSITLRQQRIEECQEFERSRRNFYQAINQADEGNLVPIIEFFRQDNHYYLTMEQIPTEKISMEEIAAFPVADRLLLCKTIAHAVMKLHEQHIVHADLKDANILLKKTATGAIVGKIIDFDAGFFESNPPQYADELGGDEVYLAPESCLFINEEDVKLTTKLDVFALGLLFHQYLTGVLPSFSSEWDYAHEAVLNDGPVTLSHEVPSSCRPLLKGMLEAEPESRPSMAQVFDTLMELTRDHGKFVDPLDYRTEKAASEGTSVLNSDYTKTVRQPSDWFHQAGDL